ncbi:nagb/rpia/CoA transferase-like protein [Aureobasidium sp. EXF-12298]|nr:nagb/rpia/CoA transferase-like protein [Aureobasidium sp. EXF-12298]
MLHCSLRPAIATRAVHTSKAAGKSLSSLMSSATLDLGAESQLSDKKAVRKQLHSLLSSLPPDHVQRQSANATKLLLSLPEYKNARSISIFMSMPSGEINTNALTKHALASGKHVFVPYIYKPKQPRSDDLPASIMDMLQLADEDDYASLQPDKWGIPSIPKDTVSDRANSFGERGVSDGGSPAPDAGLDIILMPCMAFDQDLDRLGHGKGYYDNFLTRYCSAKTLDGQNRRKPFLVGFALAEQMIPSQYRLPVDAWDWKVDAVVLGDGGSEAKLVRV